VANVAPTLEAEMRALTTITCSALIGVVSLRLPTVGQRLLLGKGGSGPLLWTSRRAFIVRCIPTLRPYRRRSAVATEAPLTAEAECVVLR
jgi:hypothetical protein